jgi:23S rRNA maturation mini-RNase III
MSQCAQYVEGENAGLSDYKKATALEGVLGYLRLVGEDERLNELMQKCIEIIDKGDKNE